MNCQHVQELLEEYSLGLLDPGMQAQVEAHLANCADCKALADGYAEALASLPEALASVSSHSIPEGMRDAVIAHVLASPPALAQDKEANVSIPAHAPTTSVPQHPIAASMHTWAMPQARLRLAFVVACILLVSLLLWSIQLNVVLARERALRSEFRELVDRQEIVLEVIDSNKTERRVLLPPEGDSRAYGKVYTRSDMPHVVAMAARLAPPPPGEAYHLWLTGENVTFLAGTLRTNDEGFGLLLFDTIDGTQYSRAIVTLQPIGSSSPIEPPILEWVSEE